MVNCQSRSLKDLRMLVQVAHVLYSRMQLPIRQGTDADVVLPSLKAAMFVFEDSQQLGKQFYFVLRKQ